MSHGFLIGAPSSGCGKTTFTIGLLRALVRRGVNVQPFKSGPDYIDTQFHRMASGRESVNLDSFMASAEHVRNVFSHYAAESECAIVEGAMGLFDGYDRWHGSSAEIAHLLGVPVILVIDAKSMAYSLAPILHGMKTFAALGETMKIAGVVLNRVSSASHRQLLSKACADVGVSCLGFLPDDASLKMPSRYLGLSLTDSEKMEQFMVHAAQIVEKNVDIDRLLELCAHQLVTDGTNVFPRRADSDAQPEFSIAVACDEAFNFTYRANIDALSAMGQVAFFSPLHDAAVPQCDLLYIPGGYPELYVEALSANEGMRRSVKEYAERGGRVLAECGGMMYLCSSIDEKEMCDVLPFRASMEGARLHMGYRQAELNGIVIRGHEFHYSSVDDRGDMHPDISIQRTQRSATGRAVDTPIYRYKNVVASYTHWYWAEKGLPLNKLYNQAT